MLCIIFMLSLNNTCHFIVIIKGWNFLKSILSYNNLFKVKTDFKLHTEMKRKNKIEEEYDVLKKIIIIGDSGVGKSNILLRYSEGKFVENYMMTIGINFMYKVTTIDDIKIKMQIWDTAGQDKYKTITQNYYKNCNGAFVVFSIDSK